MRHRIRKISEIIQIIVSILLVIIAGLDMIGKPARLVMILTLFAGSIGIGANIGVFAERRRWKRENEKKAAEVPYV
jgi:hypothetical protein